MKNNNTWEERYASGNYLYGTNPNAFFKEQIDLLTPGRILLPAEGQGRNAIYAAGKGWEVECFDISRSAKEKAIELANLNKVKIDYRVSGWEEIEFQEENFDVIAFIFAHTPGDKRSIFHRKIAGYLKPGGTVILEGFSKEQLNYSSGGPKEMSMLFSEEELLEDFNMFSDIKVVQTITTLEEGSLHKGEASVISITGRK